MRNLLKKRELGKNQIHRELGKNQIHGNGKTALGKSQKS